MSRASRVALPLHRRKAIHEAKGSRCWYCGGNADIGSYGVDHVVPVSRGGSDEDSNLVPVCVFCNAKKGALSVEEFRDLLARERAGWPHFSARQLAWLRAQGFPEPPRHTFHFERQPNAHLSNSSDPVPTPCQPAADHEN